MATELSIVTDIMGRRVPTHLVGPFVMRERLKEIVGKLKDLQNELRVMNVFGSVVSYMDPEKIDQQFNELQQSIVDNMPAIPCNCKEGCARCQEQQWISAKSLRAFMDSPEYKSAEAAQRSARLRAREAERFFELECKRNKEQRTKRYIEKVLRDSRIASKYAAEAQSLKEQQQSASETTSNLTATS